MKIEIENTMRDYAGNYESIRSSLLKNNFVIKQIANTIKRQWGPWPHHKNPIQYKQYRNTAIQTIAGLLNIDLHILEVLLSDTRLSVGRIGDIRMVSLKGIRINQPGIYARYNPNMKKEDWQKLYVRIKELAKKYSRFVYPEVDKKIFDLKKTKKQVGYSDEKKNIRMYLEIEKRIPGFWQEYHKGKEKDLFGGPGGETSRSYVVSSAIENILETRRLGNKYKKKYHDNYYRIAKRYQLPTHEELSKFLQIINTFSFSK